MVIRLMVEPFILHFYKSIVIDNVNSKSINVTLVQLNTGNAV